MSLQKWQIPLNTCRRKHDLEAKVELLDTQSRWNNLFFGIPPVLRETWDLPPRLVDKHNDGGTNIFLFFVFCFWVASCGRRPDGHLSRSDSCPKSDNHSLLNTQYTSSNINNMAQCQDGTWGFDNTTVNTTQVAMSCWHKTDSTTTVAVVNGNDERHNTTTSDVNKQPHHSSNDKVLHSTA